jgi:hypothetical protein
MVEMPQHPFASSEEAWFWFVRCQHVRREGARLQALSSSFSRPCDPDDIYRAVVALQRRGLIRAAHLRVLENFGLMGRSPDRRCPEEAPAFQLWAEALDRLTTILRGKGVVE